MTYLLDTNVVSEARRTGAAPQVLDWLRSARREETFISSLVLGEVRNGIERLRARDATQAVLLERWLRTLYLQFADRIVPIDGAVAEAWGRMSAQRPLPLVDGLMAATAKVHGLVFVTRNVSDVLRSEVVVLNPWEATPG